MRQVIRRLFQLLEASDLSVFELSIESGVGEATIRAWRHGQNPRFDLLEACFNVLGRTLVDVEKP